MTFEAMELPGEELTVLVYTAEPGSPSPDVLDLLASWAATPDRPTLHETADSVTGPP